MQLTTTKRSSNKLLCAAVWDAEQHNRFVCAATIRHIADEVALALQLQDVALHESCHVDVAHCCCLKLGVGVDQLLEVVLLLNLRRKQEEYGYRTSTYD
jgi:hypothetical protein